MLPCEKSLLADINKLAVEKRFSRKKTLGRFCSWDTALTLEFSGNVIDRLLATLSIGGRVVAYYFFDSRWKESLSIVTFLRSILHQILHQILQIDTVTPAILLRLREIFDSDIESREPDFRELQQLITDICTTLTQTEVFFVVDGLDEVDSDTRKTVMQFLGTMLSRVKIFAAGQPEVNIAAFSVNCRTINITIRDVDNDIRTFIQVRLEAEIGWKVVLSAHNPVLSDAIKEALAWKAQGMYVLKPAPSVIVNCQNLHSAVAAHTYETVTAVLYHAPPTKVTAGFWTSR
jgi:hypothetical protein